VAISASLASFRGGRYNLTDGQASRRARNVLLKILFITSNRLGDAVLSTGLLKHLIESHPHARVTVACGELPAPIFRAVPQVERVLPLEKRRFGAHWHLLWREAIGTRWDLLVDLRDSPASRLLRAKSVRIRRRSARQQHKVEELAGVLGLHPAPSPVVWIPHGAAESAAGLIPDGGPLLALAPAAKSVAKQWAPERFVTLAQRLTRPGAVLSGARVAIFGADDERAQCEPILRALGHRAVDLVGRTDPVLAAAVIQSCTLFVGNDSGLTHVAAATGTPTLALFGPGLPQIYAPWGRCAAYVSNADDPQRTVDACIVDSELAASLMAKLDVDTAVNAAEALLRSCAARGAA
jgi:heptosyltransferase III